MLLGFGVIKPGEAEGWHIHPPGEDEIFFVMEGQALAEWIFEGTAYREEISAGTAFYTPALWRTTSPISGNRTSGPCTASRDRPPLP
ncbi:MAG: cupin domain-containing protein [Desulfobacterales bacterium]|nr:cupin domain-containing protein [Desulfobacterales bacterium]